MFRCAATGSEIRVLPNATTVSQMARLLKQSLRLEIFDLEAYAAPLAARQESQILLGQDIAWDFL